MHDATDHAASSGSRIATEVRRDIARERWGFLALATPAVLVMILVLMVPLLWIGGQSFIDREGHVGFSNYVRLFSDGSYVASFWLTVRLAAAVTAICAIAGYIIAYAMTLMPAWAARTCLALIALPFWTSTLVRTYAWLVLLQNNGIVNNTLVDLGLISERLHLMHNETGTLIGMVHVMLPFMVFPLYAALQRIDPDFMKAAAGLGASALYAFRRVYLPLSLHGLLAGTVVVFVVSLGFYITPAILGGGRTFVMALVIERDINLNLNWGPASAAAVLFVAAILLMIALIARTMPLERLFSR